MIVTFDDVLDHLLGYAGADASRGATTLHRRAIQAAYQVVPTRHTWTCYIGVARVNTNGSYNTGTIEFDFTGGTYERMLTLTGGTWPAWAALGYVVINNIPYNVESRKSDTVLTLALSTCPQADVAPLTEYRILQDRYALPSDFLAGDEAIVNDVGTVLTYMHPRDWSGQRRVNVGPGQPWAYTYLGNVATPGSINMAIFPPPDTTYQIDVLYKRRARPLVYSQVNAGLVSVSGTTVTGVGVAFTAAMVGSVIRFGIDNQTVPTGPTGDAPAVFEATIVSLTSASVVEIDAAPPSSLASVTYLISDPVDLDVGVMGEYFLRECEKQWRMIARSKSNPEEIPAYERAIQQAREADNRDTSRAAVMRSQSRRSGFIHYPINFTG